MSNFRAELATFLRDKTHLARLGLREVHEVIDRLLGEGYTITPPVKAAPAVAAPTPIAPIAPAAPAPIAPPIA